MYKFINHESCIYYIFISFFSFSKFIFIIFEIKWLKFILSYHSIISFINKFWMIMFLVGEYCYFQSICLSLTHFLFRFKRCSACHKHIPGDLTSVDDTSREHFHVSYLQPRFLYLRSPRRIKIHAHDWICLPVKGSLVNSLCAFWILNFERENFWKRISLI